MKKTIKTPMGFAEHYINGKINLPLLYSYGGDSLQPIKYKLTKIEKLPISSQIKKNIYIALLNLSEAMFLSTEKLKQKNSVITKKRRATIKHLEKILEIGYPFPKLSSVNQGTIKEALERLKDEDNEKGTYHPIKELDYTVTLEKYLQSSNKPHYAEEDFPQSGKTLLTSEEKLTKEGEVYFQSEDTLKNLLYTPLEVRRGRPNKFFYKVLQIVVFKYLRKAEIPIEKAKTLATEIINEHFLKLRHPELATLKPKDIDNALHGS